MSDYKSQREYLKLYTAAVERFAENKKPFVSSNGLTVDKKFLAQCEKTICSFFKTGRKKIRTAAASGAAGASKKNVGFTKLFYFAESVIDYHGNVLREAYPDQWLPSFEKFMPDKVTPNPLYRILSHPLMTRVFSLTARITGQKQKHYYSATKDFIQSHMAQIEEARAKDMAKGYTDYTKDEFEAISKTTKKFRDYLFNPSCYTHAHQSKIIETSKDKNIDLIDDFIDEVKDSPTYQKKLDDISQRALAGGIKLSEIQAQVLAIYGKDMTSIMESQTSSLVQLKGCLVGSAADEDLVDEDHLVSVASAESGFESMYTQQDLESTDDSDED